MDGVTLDTEPLYTKAEINLFNEYNITIPEDDWSLFRGSSEKQFYKLTMKKYNIKEDFDVFMNKGRQCVQNEFSGHIPLMDGFKMLHKRISPQFLMGLVTASPIQMLNKINKKIKLHMFFDQILSGEAAKKNKPHPAPYLLMMNMLDTLPQNTIIIEDSLTGINSAIASGAHVIAKTGSVPTKKLNHVSNIINHLDEITIEFLEQILKSTK